MKEDKITIIAHDTLTTFYENFEPLATSVYASLQCPHLSVPINKIQEHCISKQRLQKIIEEHMRCICDEFGKLHCVYHTLKQELEKTQ